MKIVIEKEKRKTIFLKVIDCENVLLKVPKQLSQQKIDDFLAAKTLWLEKTMLKKRQIEAFSNQFNLKDQLFLFGERVCSVCDIKSRAKDRIKRFYQKNFVEIEKMAHKISKEIGLEFQEIKLHSSVRVWGSFNSAGVMKLNYKLVILPKRLCEYVIIHELCHGKQMNHSPNFWKLVEKNCPDYKQRKFELSKFSFVLKEQF